MNLCKKQCGKQTKGLRTVKVSGKERMFHSVLSTGVSCKPLSIAVSQGCRLGSA